MISIETRVQRSRIMLFHGIYLILAIILLIRLWHLQIHQGKEYQEKANRNLQASLFEPAQRGSILDREGRSLVENQTSWDLYFHNGNTSQLKASCRKLEEIGITKLSNTIFNRYKQQPNYEPLLLKTNLTPQELARYSYAIDELPFITLKQQTLRYYPYGKSFSHILGYTQPVLAPRFNGPATTQERAIGGLEHIFDMRLKGEPKKHLITKNAHQLQLSSALQKEAVPGETIKLTIDAQLQVMGYDLFEKFQSQGSLVCLDPYTGEVLALVSYPGYEPAILRDNPNYYDQDERRPMFFRALHGLYPPASLVKPFLGIAALEEKIVTPSVTIYDPGYYQLPGTQKRFHDWKRAGHRNTNLHQAIVESCDTYFYWLGHKMGIEKMTEWFTRFGFGAQFEAIPFTHKTGVTPSVKWKRQKLHQPWFLGETIIAAIGQGFFSTTPLHLAYAGGLMASQGKTPQPSLIKGEDGHSSCDELSKIKSWDIIHQAMREVITSPQGTAYTRLSKKLKYPLAGKTGTAQVVSNETAKSFQEFSHRDHSLFLAFGPIELPEVVVVVICEHQPFAAEIAGEFMNKALDLIQKTKPLTSTEPT